MSWGYNPNWVMGGVQFVGIYNFVVWILFVALLVGLVRWVWKKGDKRK